ncbi:glutathione ABC transporter substrate-binding protein [Brevibacillus reuszeri]|uniref:ABC transporter substrate-binding protein n=1 Tax=Brevibacillus reuszeri TaxID=54915 RepID=A0A0K9YQ93_9BACL|nr:glutathione ABC transporter substrate-binding protein [Brevibacillus reuszeri]KNB70894.1 ABC transporter substrate-binding protein [Brevibacillus reuszeri]MED1857293.1 glutathione ABC transporter substrate-binding protein [Brevibacillus reuszeri]GED66879.1 glutathione ABC transporter substrate-binding protein [Brevibacillus reuszeri]
MKEKVKHYIWLIGLLLVVGASLTACTLGKKPSDEHKLPPSKSVVEGGTLVIARKFDAGNLDPHFISTISAASVVYQKVYEGLVTRDINMVIQPQLATEWRQVDDVTWEFKLRHGVVFHDGTLFRADAVKQTFDRVLSPQVASTRAAMFDKIKEVKIIDDYTVQIRLSAPFTPILSILASHEGSILSPKAIAAFGNDLSHHPVGTGPFTFLLWTAGKEIVLKKNQNYWGEKPKLDQIIFRVIPDDEERIELVEQGEAHIAESIPVTEIDRIQASSQMRIYRSEALGTEFVGFNVAKKPLNDLRVRQAISYAIETSSIIKGIYNNVGTPANSPLGPKVFGYSSSLKKYLYDLNKARDLLEQAGYPNGFSTTILTYDRKDRVNVAGVIRSQLKGIGIDAKIQVVSYDDFVEMIEHTKEHDIFVSGWGNATGDADYNQYNLFHTIGGGRGNSFMYSNPELDRFIEAGREETDTQKRLSIYAKAQELELQEALIVPFRNLENLAAIHNSIEGFAMSPAGYLMLDKVMIKK